MRGAAIARILGGIALLTGCGRVGFDRVDVIAPSMESSIDAASDGGSDAARDATTDVGPDADRPPYCQAVTALAAAPTIDGVLEPGVVLERIVPTFWTGPTPIPEGQSASLGMGWTVNGVYFFVAVEDRTNGVPPMGADDYCGDGVELYLDWDGLTPRAPQFDDPGTRQLIVPGVFGVGARSTRATLYTPGNNLGPWRSPRFGAFATATGYVVEAFVTGPDLGLSPTATISGQIGFDISINVSRDPPSADACGGRLGQYFLRALGRDATQHPYLNSGAFCVARVVPR